MKIRTKIILSMHAGLVPLVLLGLVLIRNYQELEQSQTEMVQFTQQMAAINHLQLSITTLPAAPDDYLATNDPAERERFARSVVDVETAFAELSALPGLTDTEQRLADEARQRIDDLIKSSEAILALPDPINNPTGIALMRQIDMIANQVVAGPLSQMYAGTLQEMDVTRDLFQLSLAIATRWLFYGLPLTLIITVLIGIVLASSITAPVQELQQGTSKMASGRFDHRMAIRTRDEMGQLAQAFNAMAGRLAGLYRDLEQQVAERTAELAASEARFHGLAQTATDVIVTIDADRHIHFFNRAAERIFGFPADEVLNQNVDILIPPKYVRAHQEGVRRYLETGEPHFIGQTVELEGRRKDGEIFPLELSLSEVRTETGLNFTSIIRDISRRKQAEEQIRKLSRAVEHCSHAMFIYNRNGTVEYVNPSFTRMTGFAPDDMVGHPVSRLNDILLTPEREQEMWDTLLAGREWHGEFYNRKKNGERYWAAAAGAPIKDQNGNVTHIVEIHEDITRRKQAEAEIHQRNRDLTLLNHVIFAASASLEPVKILETVCRELMTAFDVSHTAAALLDEEAALLRIVAEDRQEDQPSVLGVTIPISDSPPMQMLWVKKKTVVMDSLDPFLREAWEEERWMAGTGSLLLVPLLAGDQALGTIGLVNNRARPFPMDEITLVEHVATAVAQVLVNARLLAGERQRRTELETLHQSGLQLASSLDTTAALEAILEHALKLTGGMDAYIFFYDGRQLIFGAEKWVEHLPQPDSPLAPRPGGMTFAVARSGQRMVIPDINHHPLYADWQWGGAIIGLPLQVGGQVRGVMNVAFSKPRRFTDDELRLLELLAAQAAVALENARLFTEINDALKREQRLTEITHTINSNIDLPVVLETIVRQAVKLVNADAGALALLDPGGESISYPYIFNLPSALKLQPARPGHGLAWRVVETGRSLLLPAYASQPDALPQWVEAGVKGIIAVPVVTGEKRIGALGLFGLRLDKQFSRRDLVLAETVGRQAGIAIQNARLFEAGQVYAAELEQRVIERTAELTRAVRARDEFLANMSHELRTPLSSILLRTEMIQRGLYGPLTDKQISSLQTIDDAGRHLLSLINDILDIAKIEAGKVDLDIQPVSIQSVCRAGLQLVKQIALQKRIELASHLDPAVAAVRADSRRLKQMLVNLLSNALKFTPEGGQVGLDVTADAEQGMILFTVWDTGIGIAQADMDRLFRPFEQLDSGLARKYEGTGLGLALVRRLAELHQGSVTVDSRIGEGSRFTISLPWTLTNGVTVTAGLQEKDSSRSDVSEMPAPTLAATILLADDNETLVTGLSEFLSQQGYHVLVARNGLEAIERAGKEKPDLILMDAHMPVLDGLEATRRIRADAALAAVPIVALTALAMSGDQERILDAGANAYLSKPVTLSALITMIEELLSGRKSK